MENRNVIESLFSNFMVGDFQDCGDAFLGWLSNFENEQKFIGALEEMRDSVQTRINISVKMVDDGFNDDEVWEKYGEYIDHQLTKVLFALGCQSGPFDE